MPFRPRPLAPFLAVETKNPRCRSYQDHGVEFRLSNLGQTLKTRGVAADCRQRSFTAPPLYLSSSPSSDLDSGKQGNNKKGNNNNRWRRFRNPIQSFKQGITRLDNARARWMARFRALPRRAKRIVLAYVLLVTLAFGSLARTVVSNSSARPSNTPVEISYSSFLDLIDGQAVDSNYNAPKMDHVRIGNDRIVYRLYNQQQPQLETTTTTTTKEQEPALLPKRNNKNRFSLELPSVLSRDAQRLAKEKQQQQQQQQQANTRPYLTAYTRPIPNTVSPQLLDQLRSRAISFAASPAPRASTLAVAVRTFMIVFYFVILLRLYKTVSGASGGGGKSETPGKLAQTSDLPMASFDEIQGIDNAKNEVMELVDTLRNPEKYAILGARAPTGLLLVGPPGTGIYGQCHCALVSDCY